MTCLGQAAVFCLLLLFCVPAAVMREVQVAACGWSASYLHQGLRAAEPQMGGLDWLKGTFKEGKLDGPDNDTECRGLHFVPAVPFG